MKKTWIEIKGKLSEHSPEISESFSNPATQDEISHLETAIGQKLPDSFVSYLLTFNGQNHNNYSVTFVGANCLLTITEIINLWTLQNDLFGDEPNIEITENKIKPKIWDKGWIPFADFMGQQRLVIDLNPGTNGTYGQILQLWAGQDLEDDEVVVAGSFEEFSEKILEYLQKEKITISDENIIEFDDFWLI